jgi:hypothetical protein
MFYLLYLLACAFQYRYMHYMQLGVLIFNSW